ncbi:bifunctional adenosylcobinamide kinase/adenosylcobinamide-phosphate guanylyltransferase [Ammonicoccus fulvus]|uniref:Adenosylcobinamide kinase n=1 Tax=Ammonicoccus fulvus TaxID=3138240 RepID=A0ABZ3FXM6_9ACTN
MTGGVRSGKSACAEGLLAAETQVSYLAPGPPWADDADWNARIESHRARRPAHWRTVENTDLAGAIRALESAALIDCFGTWLTGRLDALGAWDEAAGWQGRLSADISGVVEAWRECPHRLVGVTNEVGLGLVSEHRSGRIFADWLGRFNQQVAAVSDDVILVVAGRQLVL